MIELRGLHLGNIARSRAESVRPDLWPDHAWVPALGCTGGIVLDLAGNGAHATVYGGAWVDGGFKNVSAGDRIVSPSTIWVSGTSSYFFFGTIYSQGISTQYGRVFEATARTLNFNGGLSALDYPGVAGVTGMPISTSTESLCVVSGGGSVGLHIDGQLEHSSTVTLVARSGLSFAIGNNATGTRTGDHRVGGFFVYRSAKLQPSQILDIHADPLLPFRRRAPVFYSVPSGGGATRSLIAALTGESSTGTIAAIIARALSGDVTATSITGAITSSMARELLASLPGQSATGDVAATLQRLLLASLGGASLTGKVTSVITRELGASIAVASATGDVTASLAALVELVATISGATTTPAVAATMARALAANLAGQSTTGAIAVEFAGMLLLVASIAGTSTTGALTATTGRELRAAIAAASSTGTVDGQLLRQIAATIAGASLTGAVAAELVSLVSLAASVVGVSVTPAVLATLSRDLAAEVTAGSTTGVASTTVARVLAAAVESGSLTPDNLVLILTGLGILHDTTIISRTPRRGITSRTVRRTIHSA